MLDVSEETGWFPLRRHDVTFAAWAESGEWAMRNGLLWAAALAASVPLGAASAASYDYELTGAEADGWLIDVATYYNDVLLINQGTGDIVPGHDLHVGDVLHGSITLDHAFTMGSFSQGYQLALTLAWTAGYTFYYDQTFRLSRNGVAVTPTGNAWLYGSSGGALTLGAATVFTNAAFTFDRIDFSATISGLGDNAFHPLDTVPIPDSWAYLDLIGNGAQLSETGFLPDAAPTPEPASWTLMIAGFGMIGCALRRRSQPEMDRALVERP
jgi:hypothetical protein